MFLACNCVKLRIPVACTLEDVDISLLVDVVNILVEYVGEITFILYNINAWL